MFGSRRTVTVASVVYNMAGEEKNRPNFLKSLVVRNILSGTKESVSDTITNGYLGGPSMKFRSFYNWAKKPGNYGQIGMPTGSIPSVGTVNTSVLASVIPHDPGEEVWIQSIEIKAAAARYWAEQWVLENAPERYSQSWDCYYVSSSGRIVITFKDAISGDPGQSTTVSFIPPNFHIGAQYLFAYYIRARTGDVGSLIQGPITTHGEGAFPSTVGRTREGAAFTETPVTLSTTTSVKRHTLVEYSDGRPAETSEVNYPPTSSVQAATMKTGQEVYKRTTHQVDGASHLVRVDSWLRLFSNATVVTDTISTPVVTTSSTQISPGVTAITTVTTTTTVAGQRVKYNRTSREDTQEFLVASYTPMKMYMYRIGSGIPALDSLVTPGADLGQFFPFIPLREENKFLSSTHLSTAYEQVRKAYKKATGSKIEPLIDELKDNEDLDKIDNAYVVFGTSLNTKEEASKRYIYRFFELLQASQKGGPASYAAFLAANASQEAVATTWMNWFKTVSGFNSDNTPPEPPRPTYPQLPLNQMRVANGSQIEFNYDMRINWRFINNGSGTGKAKPGAKANTLWFEYLGTDQLTQRIFTAQEQDLASLLQIGATIEKVRLYWQRTDNSFTYLDIIGMEHQNFVYGGESVDTSIKDAMDSADESGFIIPLHYGTWRSTSIIDTSQMATACVYVVFNCYEIHVRRWYERGIFRIIFVIVIAVLAVVFTGGAGLGLLGAHLSVGVSLGFSGMTAAIIGSVVNAMAALILSTILEKFTTGFGIIGQVLSFVFMFAVGSLASSFQNTGFATINWADFIKADNLLRLTNAISSGVSQMIQLDTQKIYGQMEDVAKRTQEEVKKIQQAYFAEFGYGAGLIDPFMFVDADSGPNTETPTTFLTRTLMTGSDIVEMSQELIYEFPELSLKLPDALT